jgi:hypothetical protein
MSIEIIECEQGTPDWFACRLGTPTASCFDKVLTPTGKPSAQAEAYMHQLLAELITCQPAGADLSENEWVQRGKEMEAEARLWFELEHDVDVRQVGFVRNGPIGCSPDGLIGDAVLEVKCPAPHTHVGYLLGGDLPTKYKPQVQGQIMVCEAPHADFISYCPGMPPVVVRVERDEKYIKALQDRLDWFVEQMEEKRQRLIEAGHIEKEQAAWP